MCNATEGKTGSFDLCLQLRTWIVRVFARYYLSQAPPPPKDICPMGLLHHSHTPLAQKACMLGDRNPQRRRRGPLRKHPLSKGSPHARLLSFSIAEALVLHSYQSRFSLDAWQLEICWTRALPIPFVVIDQVVLY